MRRLPEFTKTVIALWLAASGLIILGAYYGSRLGDLGGTDALVEGMAVEVGKKEASTPVSLSQLGENISFTLAGLVAGTIFGYYMTTLFEGGGRRARHA